VQEELPFSPDLGIVNVDDLTLDFPRLKEVARIVDRQRFLHWELEFADIFEDHGGFDLILGNPPWLKVEWNEDKFIPGIKSEDGKWSVIGHSSQVIQVTIKELKTGTVTKTFMDDTLPGGPTERTITYVAPFDRCNREEDYEIAWDAFKSRQEKAK